MLRAGLRLSLYSRLQALQEVFSSIKRHLWHGKTRRAVEKITDLDAVLATYQDDPPLFKKYGQLSFSTVVAANMRLNFNINKEFSNRQIVQKSLDQKSANSVKAAKLLQ